VIAKLSSSYQRQGAARRKEEEAGFPFIVGDKSRRGVGGLGSEAGLFEPGARVFLNRSPVFVGLEKVSE